MIGIHLNVAELFADFPPELAVFLISMTPLAEMRAAIPAGIGAWDLPWWEVSLLAMAGNMVPVFLLLAFFEPVAKFLRKHFRFFDRFFEWLFEHTRNRFVKKHEKWGEFGLVFLVIIGAWTSSLAAWLFGIKYWKAVLFIGIGLLITDIVVTALSLGVFSFF